MTNIVEKNKKRIFYLDQLRALAIIMVIFSHICLLFIDSKNLTGTNWITSLIYFSITLLGVPIFLTISGALLLNREYTLTGFFKKRFSRLLIPFIFWIIIFLILGVLVFGYTFSLDYCKDIFFATLMGYSSTLWFIWMFIGIYLFMPIINDFINEKGLKGAEYFLGIWFIILLLTAIGKYPFLDFKLVHFARYMGYIVLGYYLFKKDFKISNKTLFILGIFLYIITSIITIILTNNMSLAAGKFTDINRVSIFIALQTTGFFLMFRYFPELNSNIPNKIYSFFKDSILGKITVSVSICSYGIYLAHRLIINSITSLDTIYSWNIFHQNAIIMIPIIVIIVLLISWAIIYILSKIPYLKWGSGVK